MTALAADPWDRLPTGAAEEFVPSAVAVTKLRLAGLKSGDVFVVRTLKKSPVQASIKRVQRRFGHAGPEALFTHVAIYAQGKIVEADGHSPGKVRVVDVAAFEAGLAQKCLLLRRPFATPAGWFPEEQAVSLALAAALRIGAKYDYGQACSLFARSALPRLDLATKPGAKPTAQQKRAAMEFTCSSLAAFAFLEATGFDLRALQKWSGPILPAFFAAPMRWLRTVPTRFWIG